MNTPQPIDFSVPSPETLAGVYICVEGVEEVLVGAKKGDSQAEHKGANGATETGGNGRKKRPDGMDD